MNIDRHNGPTLKNNSVMKGKGRKSIESVHLMMLIVSRLFVNWLCTVCQIVSGSLTVDCQLYLTKIAYLIYERMCECIYVVHFLYLHFCIHSEYRVSRISELKRTDANTHTSIIYMCMQVVPQFADSTKQRRQARLYMLIYWMFSSVIISPPCYLQMQ